MPSLYLIGGPNGAGKSTFGEQLESSLGINRIDPDVFILEARAKGINDEDSLRYSLQLMIDQYFEDHVSFIYESNLHRDSSYNIVHEALKHRYRCELAYMCVDNIALLKRRVNNRVILGGHDVPDEQIENRYKSSIKLLPNYLEIFDSVTFMDTSNDEFLQIGYYMKGENMVIENDSISWIKKI